MLFRTKLVAALAFALLSSPALALNIVFEYDVSNSFFTEERIDAIERAGSVYENYITDDLDLVVTLMTTTDKGALAWGRSSFVIVTDKDGKVTTVPYSSKVTFSEDWDWYSGTDESFLGFDVFSVAIHELGHVFGIGASSAWINQVSGGYFYGENAVDIYGEPVPLALYDSHYIHWGVGVESTLPGTETWQLPSYGPYATYGERIYLTDLDLAGLKDIGWDVSTVSSIPEPGTLYMLLSGLGIVGAVARRQRTRTVI